MAEEAAAGARRQDQVVVAVAPIVEGQLLLFDVEVFDLTHQHLHIRGLAHQVAQR